MAVTSKHIEAALRSVGGIGGQKWSYSELAKGANQALLEAGITTRSGAAVFIAQCMVESAYFRTTTEYGGSNASYAPYYGRGFIQVTHKNNYANFGKWCKSRGLLKDENYFVNNPDRLADYEWAWLGAVWYFVTHRHGLVKLANNGDVDAVGRAVHTGDAWASWYPNAPFHRTRISHTRAAYKALRKAGISAPNPKVHNKTSTTNKTETTTQKKEDWFDMADKNDLIDAIESSWSKSVNVPFEGKKKTRNQMMIVGYTRAGKAARDAFAALAIVREVAKKQGMTDDQLDEIESKIDEIVKNSKE